MAICHILSISACSGGKEEYEEEYSEVSKTLSLEAYTDYQLKIDTYCESSFGTLFGLSGIEEGGRHKVPVKNMPVACFLARGRIHYSISTPFAGVDME